MKPRIFIGSSKEYIEIAEAIHSNLSGYFYPEIWDQSITTLSNSTLNNLIESLSKFDFAIFILGGEDTANLRGTNVNISRDNIIFEVGLFMGKLGQNHVFIIKPNNVNLHLPTDLLGITYGEYDHTHPNKESALRPFCNQVKKQIVDFYQPTIPETGIFGENILNNKFNKIKSNSNISGINKPYYGLYAETSSSQKLSVVIENKSTNPYENVWFYDIAQKQGWLPNTYDGKQTFELDYNSIGKIKMFFKGKGCASLSIFLNDELISNKDILWE